MTDSSARIEELRKRIAEVRARVPKHDAPAGILMELDELEEELEGLQKPEPASE